MDIERKIKNICASLGYDLKYSETNPSSTEDMYEIKFWVEDRNLNKYDFKTIYIRDSPNPKRKAFKLLMDECITEYCRNQWD